MTGPRLGVDFGTSTTIGVVRRPDGRVQPLLFDGSPLLPSAVLAGPDGRLHTGRDAAHLARSAPERLEPNPKRRIDESRVLLGDAEVEVRDLIAAVLGRVAAEAERVAGPVAEAVLTHPADWGSGRRARLEEAAHRAGLRSVSLVAEPLAAATFFASTHGRELPVGAFLMVYDLGAGTADVTLLRRRPDGFAPVASDGLDELGGLDVDASIVRYLQGLYGELWPDPAVRRRLWDDVRSAKEMLSRVSGTVIMVPSLGREVPLGREELDRLARPVLAPSVAMARTLLTAAGVGRGDMGGLFLVGGSSRMPLVATLLHEALGVAPVVAEQPELVVAEGALRRTDPAPARARAAAGVPRPVSGAGPLPVSGAAAGPVTGGALPMSAPPYAASPVSVPPAPAAGPAGPGSGAASAAGAGHFRNVAHEAGSGRADRRRARRQRTAVRIGAVVAGLAVLTVAGITAYHKLYDEPVDVPVVLPHYDGTRTVDNLCTHLDLTAFQAPFEDQDTPAEPRFNASQQGIDASCSSERVHQRGKARASIVASVTVREGDEVARMFYQSVDGAARVNDQPVQLDGLGTEAVLYTVHNAPQQMKTEMTFVLGVLDHNLVWTMRVSVRRSDPVGWTTAEQNDVRDRMTTATRASYPAVTALLQR
ncbi:Hsp70 family protein [Dactylosporangium sucinum]|uniref:Molecular chaperone n=1 Tax=Dactylosporangium sucinum TaxID=1424081 RepID=A0A917X406_9ACTN|nr:Hsp70 family protein [Dactylosporangium sucinum]GGM61243.1 hypothetical protein GCM10007977_073440 [Dactylosporangium sucinum]